jgi:lipopolysaccharide export system protein LptA
MGPTRLLLGTLVLLFLWISPALAQPKGDNGHVLSAQGGPVTIHADEMAFSGQAQTVTFDGNVRVSQDDIRLTATRLEVTLIRASGSTANGNGSNSGNAKSGIRHMVATGQVVFIQGERRATAKRAVYDPTAQTVVLSGNPNVTDTSMTVSGERITVHLDSGESTVEGGTFTFLEGN